MLIRRRLIVTLGLVAMLGLPQCGSEQHRAGESATGSAASIAGSSGAGRGSTAGGANSGSDNCSVVEQCCPRLTGDDRQACDGIAQVHDDLGCLTLLALQPECKAAGMGGSAAGGATSSTGGSDSAVAGTSGDAGSRTTGGDGGTSGSSLPDGLRNFACGYAFAGVSGNPCENGRITLNVVAKDMTAAIDACVDVQPPDRDYFCCVLASDGAMPADQSQCEAAPSLGPSRLEPAWRPGRSCCRFEGETTCPP